jgi:chromosome segregation ATPase
MARRWLVVDPGGSMTDNDDRMTGVEKRFDTLVEDVGLLKEDVRLLKDDVHVLKDDVQVLKDDVHVLKDDVQVLKDDVRVVKADVARLRVLYEEHDAKIDTIAEVQAHHGNLLLDIREQLAPLRNIDDFVRRIADDHERRLSALEKHTGIQ